MAPGSPTFRRPSASSSNRDKARRFSISELSGVSGLSPNFDEPCRASLTILRAPAPTHKDSLAPASPLLSPRNAFSTSLFANRSPGGPSLLLPSLQNPVRDADLNMPRSPTDFYSPDQVLEAVHASQQGDGLSASLPGQADDMLGSPQLCPDDILLPFRDRAPEVRDVLFKSVNKALLDLLQTRADVWERIDKVLRIERDLMPDEAWIGELKAVIKPTLGEAVWERTRRCLGVDSEDSYAVLDQDPPAYVTVESVFEGDAFIESERAQLDIKRVSSPNVSPLPFVMEDLSHSPRHHRTGSTSSLRGLSPMDPISEFPEAREPPKKLDSALLAEQDRQFATTGRPRGSKRVSMISLSGSQISEEPEEDAADADAARLTRRSSNRSIESTDSPHRRLRGLKFTPVSPNPPVRDLSGSLDNLPPDSAITDDEEEPYKARHGIKYSFGRQKSGPALTVF